MSKMPGEWDQCILLGSTFLSCSASYLTEVGRAGRSDGGRVLASNSELDMTHLQVPGAPFFRLTLRWWSSSLGNSRLHVRTS